MGNDVKLDDLIKSKLQEVLTENSEKEKKLFKVFDKSGRSMDPYILSKKRIEKYWDYTNLFICTFRILCTIQGSYIDLCDS